MVYWSDDSKRIGDVIIMSDKDLVVYKSGGFSVLTLLIFFYLLNLYNSGVSLIDLTVGDILFALFWLFIIVLLIAIVVAILTVLGETDEDD